MRLQSIHLDMLAAFRSKNAAITVKPSSIETVNYAKLLKCHYLISKSSLLTTIAGLQRP